MSPAPQPAPRRSFSLFGRSRYPIHYGIITTIFWVGERATAISPSNCRSAYDSQWLLHAPGENPYYCSIPYTDLEGGHTKAEAPSMIPWFKQAFVRDGQSVLKDRWIAISKNGKVCYAQIEDSGPWTTTDSPYVFGGARPASPRAGLDVSPAVRDYLGLDSTDTTDWRFCEAREVRPGPWTMRADKSQLALLKGSQ